jgi:hypothetical protein
VPEVQSATVRADKNLVRRLLATAVGVAVVVGSLVPAVAALSLPPLQPSAAGHWIYVGWSGTKHRVVDVVRLDLIDFPRGTLSGTWTEGTAPGYTSLGLNGTECIGCGGRPGIYWDSFGVTGSAGKYGLKAGFTIRIDNNSDEELVGGTGPFPPAGEGWHGCTPVDGAQMPEGGDSGAAADLFLLPNTPAKGNDAYVFYRQAAYNGETIGIGAKVRCY